MFKAFAYYLLAARKSDSKAQFKVGVFYSKGYAVHQDYKKATKWYSGRILLSGELDLQTMTPYAHTRGLVWLGRRYKRAAQQGDPDAQCNLGWMYASGQGTEADDAQAVFWYQKAVVKGHAVAECNLGNCYHDGRGVAKDLAVAFKW